MTKEIEPVAWAVMQPDSYFVFASYDKAVAHRDICAGGDIIALYRSPNPTDKEIERLKLTDKEIEAIDWAEMDAILQAANETSPDQIQLWQKRATILRNLLERIKDNENSNNNRS